MERSAQKVVIVLFSVLFVFGLFASPAWAIWQALLDEDFNKDQANPNLRWPWITHRLNNPPRIWRWHHNPRNWPPTTEPDYSPASWGIQDLIFNARMTPNDEIQQSIWCAYCDFNGPNNPQWPDEDEYLNNMFAWTWWGPINTEGWIGGAVSYWMFIDLDRYARDSLSIVLSTENYLTSDNDAFRENCMFGRTYARGSQPRGDWEFAWFYLDSLYVDGEQVDAFDMEEVYLAFVWNSDERDIAGTGAFIDDVIISWDDGLFDVYPRNTYIGHIVNEDSTYWTRNSPSENDEIKFRLDWAVEGVGETPEFLINCYLDDNLIQSDTVIGNGDLDTTYTIIADTLWTVFVNEEVQQHVVRWELDVPVDDGGVVEETDEDNNVADFNIFVDWNPAPQFEIITPELDSTRVETPYYEIHWTVTDSNEFDDTFRIFLYWVEDTTGMAENPDLIYDYPWIYSTLRAPRGEGSHTWDMRPAIAEGVIELGDLFWIVGFASDGYQDNRDISISPGRLWYKPDDVKETPEIQPLSFGLTGAYPNPFNDAVTIDYSLPVAGDAALRVYDMAGRNLAVLADGQQSAGNHTVSWHPAGIPAGVYMVRLESGDKSSLLKVVYMP